MVYYYLWCFSIFVKYYFQVSFNLKAIVRGQNKSKSRDWTSLGLWYVFLRRLLCMFHALFSSFQSGQFLFLWTGLYTEGLYRKSPSNVAVRKLKNDICTLGKWHLFKANIAKTSRVWYLHLRLIFDSWEIPARSTRIKFKRQNQNGGTCIVRDCHSFVLSCNFTDKAILHSSEVEIHTRQKLCHIGRYVAKGFLFC